AIGVAPDATWIAVKLYYDAGQASYSDIHLAFQWLLDPDGDLNTVDAPDVVNASWGLVGTAGQCIADFNSDIDVLKAAGTAVAFAAGNDGSAALTSLSPANNLAGFSTGAVDSTLTIANFSSRGPSACDGSIYPKMTAPGVSIRTADLSFGGQPFYMVVTGTSFAAPHTAGVMALLAGAFPQVSVSQLETAMMSSAQDIGVPGADNSYGYGLDDALTAYQTLLNGMNHPPTITSTPPTTAMAGSPYTYVVKAIDPDGDTIAFSLSLAPAGMTINASTGVISWMPGITQVGANAVTLRAADSHGVATTQSFSVMVTAINAAPIAANDVYSMAAGSVLSVPAPGTLSNDGDPNGGSLTAVLLSGTSRGRLTLNSNGSFSYIPNARFAGTDSFIYRAYDGALFSNNATVSIKVTANKPPVANNDSATASYRQAAVYTPVAIDVLANDFDADGSIDPASIAVVNAPNRGGTVVVNANGTVSYTPKKGLRGIETFRYSVRDNLGARSNPARVIIRVK
ncbi:MAG: Ig-like domain-containing protein, partial [Sulfuriferula sp.]